MGLLTTSLALTVIPLLKRPQQDTPDVLLSRAQARIDNLEALLSTLIQRVGELERAIAASRAPPNLAQAVTQQYLTQAQAYQRDLLMEEMNAFSPYGDLINCTPSRASVLAQEINHERSRA